MNREIKFRALDLDDNLIKEIGKIEFFEDGKIIVNDEIPVKKLIEYTGLKDKNGKEIYEGDICRASRGEQEKPDSHYEIKGRVIWFRGGFQVFSKSLSDFYTDDKGNIKDCSWCWHGHNNIPDIYEEILDVEIIGNIFENPDLIKT